jgi:hypothetical protein
MAGRGIEAWQWLTYRASLRFWRRLSEAAATAELGALRRQRARARALREPLDRLIQTADARLALPRVGSSSFPRPPGTEWAWRPLLWRVPLPQKGLAGVESRTAIGPEATIFHDCRISELTLRQLRNLGAEDLAPYALRLDVFRFDGSFLSLVIDLPEEACRGLKKRHLIGVDCAIALEKPLEVFARLNVRHGPNTEQIVREMPVADGTGSVEFDLAYTRMNEKRVDKMWLDLIFEGPEMNQITLRDLTLARYPRAEL